MTLPFFPPPSALLEPSFPGIVSAECLASHSCPFELRKCETQPLFLSLNTYVASNLAPCPKSLLLTCAESG